MRITSLLTFISLSALCSYVSAGIGDDESFYELNYGSTG